MSEEAVETKAEPTVDDKAKTMGHVSKEDWKGNPDDWRPAAEFVERGEKINPILNKRIVKMEEALAMSVKMNEKRDQKIRDEAFEKATGEYDKKIEELDKKEIKAFAEADEEAYVDVKKERSELKAPEKPAAEAESKDNPAFEDWSKKNAWYSDNEDLREYADMFGSDLAKKKPGMGTDELYDAVSDKVKKMFPGVFTNPNRENAQSVEGEGGSPSNTGKNTYSDLPSAAKAACDKLVKASGGKYKKEDYVEAYYE